MADIDYYNGHSAKSFDSNFFGDELNQSVLNDSSSHAGAREFSYSSKKSGGSEKVETESSTSNQTELTNRLTSGDTSTITSTIGTSAAVGGVVIATVVIFTSLLGNQFKVVDNSTSLSLYRTEENAINLDYSFDVQYDRSGSVFVKLLSTSHNLTSEEYKLEYEDIDSIITYEEAPEEEGEEQEESRTVEKAKEIYTISINGTFNSLIEGNEYTFAITSVIEGVESRIYSQRLYIPSSYVNVVEDSVEVYQEEDTINAFYYFNVEYETSSEAYVELKHLVDNEKYVVEQTSETYYLTTDNGENKIDENKYMSFMEGEFTNLEEDNEYIVSVITKSNGKENTAYSKKLVAHFDKPETHIYGFVNDPLVGFTVDKDVIQLNYSAAVNAIYQGSIEVRIIDDEQGSLGNITTFEINPNNSSAIIEGNQEVTLGHEYTVTFISYIGDYSEIIWENTYLADGEFGYIDLDNTAISAYSAEDGQVYHYLDYEIEFMTKCSGTNLLMRIYDGDYNLLATEVIYEAFTHNKEDGYMAWTAQGTAELSDFGPYNVEIYATYGSEHFLESFHVLEDKTFELVDEPSVHFVTNDGTLTLSYSASVIAEEDGAVIAIITDIDTKQIVENHEFTITAPIATSGFVAGGDIEDKIVAFNNSIETTVGHNYELVLTSVIRNHEEIIYDYTYLADGEFGYIDENNYSFTAIESYENDNTIHTIDYSFTYFTSCSGSDLTLEVLNSNEELINTETIASEIVYSSSTSSTSGPTTEDPEGYSSSSYEGSINVSQAGPYIINIYATYGSRHLVHEQTINERHVYELRETPIAEIGTEGGVLKLFYSAAIAARYEGSVYVNVYDAKTESDLNPVEHTVVAGDAEVVSIDGSIAVTIGHSYEISLISSIGGYEQTIWTNSLIAEDKAYGEINAENTSFAAITYPDDDNASQHKFTYSIEFITQLSGENLTLQIYDNENTLIQTIVLADSFEATSNLYETTLNYEDTLNLSVGGPYTVKINVTYASVCELYSTTVTETEASFYDINSDNFSHMVYFSTDESSVVLDISIDPITATEEGYIYFELVNDTTNQVVSTSEYHSVSPATTSAPSVSDLIIISDVTTNYTLKVRSVIEEDILVYTQTIDTNLVYGDFANEPEVKSTYDQNTNAMKYTLTYSYHSYLEGTISFTISNGNGVIYTYNDSTNTTFTAGESKDVSIDFTDFEEGVTYTITFSGEWGQGELELYSDTFTVSNYGIAADDQNAQGKYDDSTYTIPVTITDPDGVLSNIQATLTIGETTYNGTLENGSYVFDLTGAEKGTYGILTITATDSNNATSPVTFVNIAIWY